MDTGLILAGGSARRFGRMKALADVHGKPMIRRVFDALAPRAVEIVISVADPSMADSLHSILPEATFAIDGRPATGPIEGIIRGAEVARGERLLVAPCDAPLLRSQLYSLLLDALGRHDASVPRLQVFDPVRAVYRVAAIRRVFGKTNRQIPSPSALVDRLDAVFVDEVRLRSVDPRLDSFLDVNDESDLREVLARFRSASHSA